MKYVILPVRSTKEGRKRGEFPVGTVHFADSLVHFEVPDRRICERLRKHFSQDFRVRVFRGSGDNIMAHGFESLPAGNERHFDEALRRLLRLDFMAIPESEL